MNAGKRGGFNGRNEFPHFPHRVFILAVQARWNGGIGAQLHFGHDVLPREGMGREKAGVGAISSHKRFNVKRDACITGNVIMFLAGAKGGGTASPPRERN